MIPLTTALKYLGGKKKPHCEGRDCKTKANTYSPLKIKHWTDRLGKGTNYSDAVK